MILLVEDHAAFRQALAFLLSREEIEALPDERLDVAVLDIGLPDGDGREPFGRLRSSNPSISVVVLSATIEAGQTKQVLRAGADAVLDKIEAPQTIAAEVKRLAGDG